MSIISYTRLSIYFSPFYQPYSRNFKNNTNFEDIIELYSFDRALRLTVLEAIDQIEIAVRTVISNHMAVKYNDAFWYTNQTYFLDKLTHANFIKFCIEYAGRENFFYYDKELKHEKEKNSAKNKHSELYAFYSNYDNKLPPSWLLIEVLPMGCWSKLFSNLADNRTIANTFGFNLNDFSSWLQAVTVYRNCIAHHRRFGDEDFSALHPKNQKKYLTDCGTIQNIYRNYLIIFRLLQGITSKSDWKIKLRDTLEQCPFDIHTCMNFPVDWDKLDFWTRLD